MSAPIVTTFDVTRPNDDANELRFTLNVKNNTTKMLELRFPDGQTHDFVVKDFAGKEVWRWSTGRMFTSAMRSETLKGKEDTSYEESWSSKGQHGSFTAVAILRSNNFPVETSVQFGLLDRVSRAKVQNSTISCGVFASPSINAPLGS